MKAARTAATAQAIVDDDPESALVLTYDAGRQVATGLLAQQGLRPTTAGGHVAVVKAIVDQFNGPSRNSIHSVVVATTSNTLPTQETWSSRPKCARRSPLSGFLVSAAQILPVLGFFDS